MNDRIISAIIDREIEETTKDLSFYDAPKIEAAQDHKLRVYSSIFPQNEQSHDSDTARFIIGIFRNRIISGEDIEDALTEVIEIAVEAERHAIFMRYHSHSR